MHQQDHTPTTAPYPDPAWNDTARSYPRDCCVHELVEAQVQRRASSVAVVFGEQQLTYEELNRRSNQLAHYLRKRGVKPDVLVGLCVERSLEMIVGLLGILKAGGAYVPLDPAYPKERIAYIMEDAHAPVLLTQQRLLPDLPEQKAEIVLLDGHWAEIAKEDSGNPARSARAENLAYVIYTSGSTGKPKGVQLEHRSVVNFLCTMREEPGLNEDDVMAAVTTLCFDIAGLEIYLPLVVGAQVGVISREEASDGRKLQERMQRCGVTVMQATPATWRLLLEAGWPGNGKLKILCGGEAFPRELANKLLPRCGSLWNMYGPTETTIWSAVYRVSEGEGLVPIGHPIANTSFYVVDEQMKQVPVGQEGQLLIGGEGLARGYQNRPDLTAEKFIPDPFANNPGARVYLTGDLARYLPDGNIAFLGRIDHQVKIRGFRIELGEIESVLAVHPSVHHCVVIAREDTPGDKRLVAYIVPTADQRPVSRILRDFLKTKLPDYMVPSGFVVLDAMPLTPNGKVDRKALPAPTRENSAIEREFLAPRDKLEKELVGIWETILGIKPIGVTDDIFDLGVDSLIAAQLFARIEKTLGKNLPPAPLFQAPTVAALAGLLRQGDTSNGRWTSLVGMQLQGTKKPLFCVHGGAGTVLLFNPLARRLAPERPVYGFQSQGLYGRDLPHTNIEEMAAHYIQEMRSVQPRGPYLLGGWCFGGLVAYEMAQQLQRMGEQVELLAMFNAPSTPDYRALNTDPVIPPLAVRLHKTRQKFSTMSPAQRFRYVTRKVKAQLIWRRKRLRKGATVLAYRATRQIRQRVYRYYLDRRRPLPDVLRNSYFLNINALAERRYQHQPYSGTMVVFRDQGPYPDPYLGWGRFVQGEIESYEIPVSVSHHRALMQEPAVRLLAERMEEYLSRKSSPGYAAGAQGLESTGQAIEANVVQ
jgi:amino acid adenylation domain-containing protein